MSCQIYCFAFSVMLGVEPRVLCAHFIIDLHIVSLKVYFCGSRSNQESPTYIDRGSVTELHPRMLHWDNLLLSEARYAFNLCLIG